jgi:hypothetical protein
VSAVAFLQSDDPLKGKTVNEDLNIPELKFLPLTRERWTDFEELFGAHGACGGCWCMWWRLKRSEFMRLRGEGNRKTMKSIVGSGEVPGILAYAGGKAVGWCAVAPRESLLRLERSRVLKPVDDKPVWSVACFFVAKPFRHKSLMVNVEERLLKDTQPSRELRNLMPSSTLD